jgi:hypothetical protein
MASIQVILHGIPGGTIHDTESYPVILQFNEGLDFEEAVWVIPSYPGHIPGDYISEIRVLNGSLEVMVDGPGGFQSGPHTTNWIRGSYPRGKLVAFLNNKATNNSRGVTVEVREGSIIVDDLPQTAPAAGST